ncbi:MAG TPA: nitroreductase [Micromonosporaceae bacterium]
MSANVQLDRARVTDALAAAATAAGLAPSIHNTQPWRWRIHDGVADLHADESRWLAAADPDRRMLVLSCGAALHHARVALAAEGFAADVRVSGDDLDPNDANPLATIAVSDRTPVTMDAMRHVQTLRIRHTDRRPPADVPVPPEAIDAICAAVRAVGVGIHVLADDGVLELAAATDHAQRAQVLDDTVREELANWSGTAADVGVPDRAIPAWSPLTTVPGRDFGHAGSLDVSGEHDRHAVFAILYGATDALADWLRGGEALSAAWLAAIEHNVALLPMSAAVEEPATRQALRRILCGVGYPLIALRIAVADGGDAAPRTPRLPAAQTVEIAR